MSAPQWAVAAAAVIVIAISLPVLLARKGAQESPNAINNELAAAQPATPSQVAGKQDSADAATAAATAHAQGEAKPNGNAQPKVEKDQALHSKEPATSISLDKLKKLLTAKTWYFHWEEQPPSRNHPLRFLPNGHVVGDPGGNWAIEPMWVIKNAGSYHVLIDDKTIRGFFVPTGRQTGMIAD